MQLGQQLSVRQGQSLVMTPQLRQAIKLLQLSNQERSQYVDEIMQSNPFLENKNNGEINNSSLKENINSDNLINDSTKAENSLKKEKSKDDESVWEESYKTETKSNIKSSQYDDISSIEERIAAPKKTLRNFLLEQISIDIKKSSEKNIALSLLDLIDSSGWLTAHLNEIAENNNWVLNDVELVLAKLQKMEPVGIFARNLGECLKIQLIESKIITPSLEIVIDNLDLLAKGEIEKLSKIVGVDKNQLSVLVKTIRTLNPKPAEGFDAANTDVEPPDVIVTKSSKGWKVHLNKSTLPSINVNENFAEEIKSSILEEEGKKYVGENLNSARWLVRAIQQRNNTTLKVALEILRQQKDFFRNGPGHLKPLVLKDIADAIEMHESTVSRVTRSKLILTPWGLFQMKDFFSASIGINGDSDGHAATTVREMIKKVIENEPNGKPYSDDNLAVIMSENGVAVARRTVAKYREMLNIPSSAERRRLMRLKSLHQ